MGTDSSKKSFARCPGSRWVSTAKLPHGLRSDIGPDLACHLRGLAALDALHQQIFEPILNIALFIVSNEISNVRTDTVGLA